AWSQRAWTRTRTGSRHGPRLRVGRLQQGNRLCSRRVTGRSVHLECRTALKEEVPMRNPGSTLTRPLLRLARSARLLALLAVAVAVVAGITPACSGSTASSHSAAHSHATGRAHSGGGPLAFSACMRSHGVHNFPDPSAGSSGQSVTIPQGS